MNLIDGPTGQELARQELSDPIYAEAQPGLVERIIQWLLDTLNRLLEQAEGAPGGRWVSLLLVVGIVAVGFWALRRWRASPKRSRAKVFEADEADSATDHLAKARSALSAGDWSEALLAATRAIVADLQETSRVTPGPGVTVADVRRAVPDRHLSQTLDLFERVRYGGQHCTRAEAEAAMGLAVSGVPESTPAPAPSVSGRS